ncbi:MAG: prolyl oligopeptidase family serine peptidase [Chloroflexota bacterium]|nr:prolyl oligopeptidase family serine peptidase [Chloroflexota bacterium]
MTHPPTRQEPVEETLHGRRNVDPFRWLEDENHPDLAAWTAAQNAYTEAQLAAVPGRDAIRRRLAELLNIGTVGVPVVRGGHLFYTRRDSGQDQPILYTRTGDGPERVLLDPAQASAAATVALDWWYPSDDGRLLAYGYSDEGDEKSTLYVLDVTSGTLLPDHIPHTRYSSVAWEPDGGGFYYARYPAPGSVPAGEENYHQHVFHHRLGTDPAADPDLFGAGQPMTNLLDVSISPEGRWLIVTAYQGTNNNELYSRDLRAPAGAWQPLITGHEAHFQGVVRGNTLYLHTDWQAPHWRVLAVDLAQPDPAAWRELVAERPDTVIEGLEVIGDRLVLQEQRNVTSQVAVYSLDGTPLGGPTLPLGSVTALHGEWDGSEVFIGFESFIMPPTVYRYDLPTGDLTVWAQVDAPDSVAAMQVEQVWYPSKDGTQVPMFIVSRSDLVRNGDTPTVLHGYGGFLLTNSPTFRRSVVGWVERGGLFALANLRGGSEFGEEWHRAGMLGNKQNVFDDFIAAGEYLIRAGYTNPQRLGIYGRSNGGLLVGAALTQRPDLWAAVVCQVPLLDMLRYHHYRIARLWIPEYGSADDPEQIDWLWAYSPYQHVQPGTDYPSVLLMTAESDSRVDPLHARKMAALLQSLEPRRPVLLRVESAAGHGIGKPISKLVDEETAIWTFLSAHLDLPAGAPPALSG